MGRKGVALGLVPRGSEGAALRALGWVSAHGWCMGPGSMHRQGHRRSHDGDLGKTGALLNGREGATQEMTNPELRSGPGSPTQIPELRDPEKMA